MSKHQLPIIFVYGPTAVGKSQFAESLAQKVPAEIVNMDSAQCYTELKIGTAKPNWQASETPHHLFDIIDAPVYTSVTEYRERALAAIAEIRKKGKVPIFVGGSGFYLMSLLFPPVLDQFVSNYSGDGTWQELNRIDPDRAANIHPNDQYRIDRALDIWHAIGVKPSEYTPQFDAPGDFSIFFLTRDRQELRDRIEQRVDLMLQEGLVQEVASLSPEWHNFLKKKKFIGYPQVLYYLEGSQTAQDYQKMRVDIINKTAAYAKRQWTFWRMLKGKIDDLNYLKKGVHGEVPPHFDAAVINLTLSDLDLYIKQLSERLLGTINTKV